MKVLTLSPGNLFMLFVAADFFFSKKKMLFRISSESNRLHPDQAKHFFRPDLGSNLLQRLSGSRGQ